MSRESTWRVRAADEGVARMKSTKWIFRIAGIYGLAILIPQYFLESQVAKMMPPAISHPEFYYGFIGVAVAWQIAFLIIAHDPARYRPIILAAVFEKFSFGIACIILFAQQRLALQMLLGGLIDLALGTLFVIAYWRESTRP